jgi:hypothetical protein
MSNTEEERRRHAADDDDDDGEDDEDTNGHGILTNEQMLERLAWGFEAFSRDDTFCEFHGDWTSDTIMQDMAETFRSSGQSFHRYQNGFVAYGPQALYRDADIARVLMGAMHSESFNKIEFDGCNLRYPGDAFLDEEEEEDYERFIFRFQRISNEESPAWVETDPAMPFRLSDNSYEPFSRTYDPVSEMDGANHHQSEEFILGCSRATANREEESFSRMVVSILASGLLTNRSLKDLSIYNVQEYMDDRSLAHVMRAVAGHPSLASLTLYLSPLREQTKQALTQLLSHPRCKITSLTFRGGNCLSTDLFHECLSTARGLEILDLECTQMDATTTTTLLRQIPSWYESLHTLLLGSDFNETDTLATLARSLADYNDNTSRLRYLKLLSWRLRNENDFSRLSNEVVKDLVTLFRIFPELSSLGLPLGGDTPLQSLPVQVQRLVHRLDMNRCGGYLMMASQTNNTGRPAVPLSWWSLLLEKTSTDRELKDSKNRQVNVIYHLLQGPAFAGRGAISQERSPT